MACPCTHTRTLLGDWASSESCCGQLCHREKFFRSNCSGVSVCALERERETETETEIKGVSGRTRGKEKECKKGKERETRNIFLKVVLCCPGWMPSVSCVLAVHWLWRPTCYKTWLGTSPTRTRVSWCLHAPSYSSSGLSTLPSSAARTKYVCRQC